MELGNRLTKAAPKRTMARGGVNTALQARWPQNVTLAGLPSMARCRPRKSATFTRTRSMTATTRPAPSVALPLADSPLGRTISTTATDIWNDSCAIDELEYAISYGAVGATANPTIVTDVWKKEPGLWRDRVRSLAAERPTATEIDLARLVVEEMSRRGAKLLEPAFEAYAGRQGRLSVQTDPMFFRSPDRMLDQGVHFDGLAPNIIVKFPATTAGIPTIEEATYRGVNVNTTVCFSVAQAIAAAEAIERGLRRREAEGLAVDRMGPVVTIMMGRIEDWLRLQTERDGIVVDPAALPWSGVAVFKRACGLFRERGYRAAARRGDPPSLPLVRADRRRRRHHDAFRLAETLQRVRHRGPGADRRPGRPGHRGRALRPFPGLRPRVRAGWTRAGCLRCVPADCADTSRLHRLVSRAAPPGDRRDDPEPGRPAGLLTQPRSNDA